MFERKHFSKYQVIVIVIAIETNRDDWMFLILCNKKEISYLHFQKFVSITSKSEFLIQVLQYINGSKIILIISDEYKISLDFCNTFPKIIKRPGKFVLFPKEDIDMKIDNLVNILQPTSIK